MVLIISFITAITGILHVIIGFFKTPPGTEYLWTGHYYLDYFQYVQAFAQGIQGKWLLDNPLTLEKMPGTFIGMWQFLILGKMASLAGLSPIAAFWFFTFIFQFILAVLIFILIRRLLPEEPRLKQLTAFILTLYATPFYYFVKTSDGWILNNFGFWSDKSVLWKRFESIPYHLTANILTILILFWFMDTLEKMKRLSPVRLICRALGIAAAVSFTLTFSPSTAILLSATCGVYCLFQFLRYLLSRRFENAMRVFIFILTMIAVILPAAVFIRLTFKDTYYENVFSFEKLWQVRVNLLQFFLVHGPLSLLALFGIKTFFNKISIVRLVFLTFVFISYSLFYSPLALILSTTNTRFLTPLSYVLFAVLAVIWIKGSSKVLLLGAVLLLFFLPANIKALKDIVSDRNIFSPITYLPADIIDGFKFVDRRPEKGNVLLTPSQFLGTVLPIYADRKVYIGRPNMTLDYLQKNITASNFYLHVMSDQDALKFLSVNSIKFVIFTSIEGYDLRQLLKYPFLESIYKSKNIIVFRVK